MKILVTGGAGYIGSHTVIQLLEQNFEVVIVDNFSNSSENVLQSIKEITGKEFYFYQGGVEDKELLMTIFREHQIDAVIHFAGFKAVGESVSNPLKYYDNNLISTLHLLEVMKHFECKKLVFSSSATVYGKPEHLPILEKDKLSTTNPYGTTKLMIEQILRDFSLSDNSLSIVILRYFNPIGAHESGKIFENPKGIPNNLMPYIIKVANQEIKELQIFGDDYDTIDGTGVRDYIHVSDLANGHLKAINFLEDYHGIETFNLGTGRGVSVLELVKTFEKVNKITIPYKIVERRKGDIDACYADVSKAREILHFESLKDIEDMCRDSYLPFQNK